MSKNTTQNDNQMISVETGFPARSKEATKAGYDRLSGWYDVLTGSYSKKFRDIGLGKLDVKNGETILEIGYGSGHCIKALAELAGSTGKVYGLDISEGMRQVTNDRIEEAGLSSRVQLYVGDAVRLPFEDGFFDAIFTSFTLEMLDAREIPVVLGQCMRVLKNGGRRGVVSLFKQTGKENWMMRLYRLAYEHYPDLAGRPSVVRKALEENRFQILNEETGSLMGLPVEIIVARKP